VLLAADEAVLMTGLHVAVQLVTIVKPLLAKPAAQFKFKTGRVPGQLRSQFKQLPSCRDLLLLLGRRNPILVAASRGVRQC
jgi:hypothetical protein